MPLVCDCSSYRPVGSALVVATRDLSRWDLCTKLGRRSIGEVHALACYALSVDDGRCPSL
jgi:hypothetical protein